MDSPKPDLSVVIPVHNEAGNLEALHAELLTILKGLDGVAEVIYVNDGSTDGSADVLAQLSGATVITLTRRFGQASALAAGFAHARAPLIVSLDGDGQNDPADIPRLLQELEQKDLDVVTGWRKERQDVRGIRILTRIGRTLRNLLINDRIHDSGCTLRVYRRAALEGIELYGEMHRYLLALIRWRGFHIGEVKVADRPRAHGVSKYGYGKAVRGFIDLVYVWFLFKYADRPLHLFGYLSLASFGMSAASFFVTVFEYFAYHTHANRNSWFFMAFFFLMTGIMLFSFGIVIDLLLSLRYGRDREKRYYVRSIGIQ